MTGKVAPAPRIISARPVFVAGPAGSPISPNLAGRLAAAFAVCYQLERTSHPDFANQCLKNAEHIFALADTSYADPAASVGSGTCNSGCLLTIMPFDGYPVMGYFEIDLCAAKRRVRHFACVSAC